MDRVIVVTGAFGALGRGFVEAARAKGAKIAALDYAPAPDGYAADFVQGGVDLSKAADAKAAIDAAAAKLGRIDGIANIAGGFGMEKIGEGDGALWDKLFSLNLKTCANSCAAAIPHLKASGTGAIVNVGAMGALHAGSGMGPYAASKSGVHRLTEALAAELKGQVTANAVMPSTIDTPANRRDMPKADYSKWVTPAELASVILFLLSDEARAVTGALIPVAGRV